MPRILFVALVATIVASEAIAAKAIVRRGFIPGGVPTLPCSIQIDFSSPGPGPDLEAFFKVKSYIIETSAVDLADAWGWGEKGEFSLCLKVYDPAAATRVLGELNALAATLTAVDTTTALAIRRGETPAE